MQQPQHIQTSQSAGNGLVRCWQCGETLGELQGDHVHIVHKGREIDSPLPLTQRCHRCHQWNSTGAIDTGDALC